MTETQLEIWPSTLLCSSVESPLIRSALCYCIKDNVRERREGETGGLFCGCNYEMALESESICVSLYFLSMKRLTETVQDHTAGRDGFRRNPVCSVFTPSTSDTKCVGFFLTPANSPAHRTPAGCPTIQFSCDSNLSPDSVQTPQGKGSVPQDTPTSEASHRSQVASLPPRLKSQNSGKH